MLERRIGAAVLFALLGAFLGGVFGGLVGVGLRYLFVWLRIVIESPKDEYAGLLVLVWGFLGAIAGGVVGAAFGAVIGLRRGSGPVDGPLDPSRPARFTRN